MNEKDILKEWHEGKTKYQVALAYKNFTNKNLKHGEQKINDKEALNVIEKCIYKEQMELLKGAKT